VMAAATIKGRARGAGTGAVTDLTGAQVGAIARWTGLEGSTLAGGATYTLTLLETTTHYEITTTGTGAVVIDAIVHGSSNSGARIVLSKSTISSAAQIVLRYNGGNLGNRIETPQPGGGDYTLEGLRAGVALIHNGFVWTLESRHISPYGLAPVVDSFGVEFVIGPITLTATGAGADDVAVYSASAPFAFRVLRMLPVVTAGVAAGTLQARTATGGGGAAVSSTFGATVASDDPIITANNGVTGTIAAGGTLVIRRSSGNITGEVFFSCMRT
jgi:hypothetical protein